jgi:hypothetical protein
MPPRFNAASGDDAGGSSNTSRIDTSGAPWPPTVMSRARRSDTTGRPVRAAIQAGCPSCNVPSTEPSDTQW